jgi:hypothetical protein
MNRARENKSGSCDHLKIFLRVHVSSSESQVGKYDDASIIFFCQENGFDAFRFDFSDFFSPLQFPFNF